MAGDRCITAFLGRQYRDLTYVAGLSMIRRVFC
jgi:hypothetical protein